MNKLILLDDDDRLLDIRAELAAYLGGDASLTRSVPGMLEILPPGTAVYVSLSVCVSSSSCMSHCIYVCIVRRLIILPNTAVHTD